jgi:hypothetical protein
MRDLNKATKRISDAQLDLGESKYIKSKRWVRLESKRRSRRASRRFDKAIIQEAA